MSAKNSRKRSKIYSDKYLQLKPKREIEKILRAEMDELKFQLELYQLVRDYIKKKESKNGNQ
jgi:hypothetical protein